MRAVTGLRLCDSTLWRYLNDIMPRFKAIPKPLMLKDDHSLRLKYCLAMRRQDFDNLVFVDEKIIYFGGPNAHKYVRVFSPRDPLRFAPHRGQAVLKLHFIGAMSMRGAKILHFFDRPDAVNSYDIYQFLQQLKPLMGPEDILLVDNCSSHKELAVRRMIESMRHLAFYPPRSPELNAIEYCWAHMENLVKWSTVTPSMPTKNEAKQLVERAWHIATCPSRCQRHAERTWDNMQSVIAVQGDNRFIEVPYRVPAHYRQSKFEGRMM